MAPVLQVAPARGFWARVVAPAAPAPAAPAVAAPALAAPENRHRENVIKGIGALLVMLATRTSAKLLQVGTTDVTMLISQNLTNPGNSPAVYARQYAWFGAITAAPPCTEPESALVQFARGELGRLELDHFWPMLLENKLNLQMWHDLTVKELCGLCSRWFLWWWCWETVPLYEAKKFVNHVKKDGQFHNNIRYFSYVERVSACAPASALDMGFLLTFVVIAIPTLIEFYMWKAPPGLVNMANANRLLGHLRRAHPYVVPCIRHVRSACASLVYLYNSLRR